MQSLPIDGVVQHDIQSPPESLQLLSGRPFGAFQRTIVLITVPPLSHRNPVPAVHK